MTDQPPAAAPEAPGAASAAEARALAFADADSAKRWARGLPVTNVGLVGETVLGQLAALGAARFAPRERATIAEVLRDLITYLHRELARRYAGKPQPAVDREYESAEQAIALWQGLWEQYSTCLKPLLDGDPELAGVKPKILQRGLYVGKQLVVVHGLARRCVPGTIWRELHAYYRLAEVLDCAVTAVSDNLTPNAVGLSCFSTYSHALLLGLADPCSMTVKQIELTDRWLCMWARKIFPYARQRETEGAVVLIDLDAESGASLVAAAPAGGSDSLRYGYPGKLANSVRGRLKRLQSGASPAELQLGQDGSAAHCAALLAYLDAHWCQLPKAQPRPPPSTVELCAGGLSAAYFRVGGRSFNRNELASDGSYSDVQRLQVLGRVEEFDSGKEEAERLYAWERWYGSFEVREAVLTRSSDGDHRWALDQLAVVRAGGLVRAGFVTRVAQRPDLTLDAKLRFWSGAPKAIALVPLTAAGSEEPALPALIQGEAAEGKVYLVLPPRTFSPSRVLRSIGSVPERRFRLKKLLQRGADFECAAFEVVT